MSKAALMTTEDYYYKRVWNAFGDLDLVADDRTFYMDTKWPGDTPSQRKDNIVAEILTIMEECPSISHRNYEFWGGGLYGVCRTGTPLLHFLRHQVGVTVLKQLAEISPNVDELVATTPEAEDGPLHVACKYCSIEIIVYLASLKPDNLILASHISDLDDEYCQFGSDQIPLLYAMENENEGFTNDRVANLKKIIELCPRALENTRLWTTSFLDSSNFPLDFLEWMAQISATSKENCPSKLHLTMRNGGTSRMLGLCESKIICMLLPHLEYLYVDTMWERSGLLLLLHKLQDNKSVSNLILSTETDEKMETTRMIQHEFQILLENNTVLRSVKVRVENKNSAVLRSWMEPTQVALAKNQTLSYFRFYSMLSGSRIRLIANRAEDSSWHAILTLSGCDISFVTFENRGLFTKCKLNVNASTETETALAEAEETLRPPNTKVTNATNAVLSMLNKNSHAFHLCSFDGKLDFFPIVEALKTDRQLEYIRFPPGYSGDSHSKACREMLQVNTTLTTFRPNTDSKVEYLLDLNASGRAAARKFDGSTLVALLRAAWAGVLSDSKSSFLPGTVLDDEEQNRIPVEDPMSILSIKRLSVVYGLLREAPILWSKAVFPNGAPSNAPNTTDRKRKAPPE